MPLPSPPSGGLFDPRAFVGWGISLFAVTVAAFGLFMAALRAQKPGAEMSRSAKVFLGIGVSAATASSVLLSVALDLFGHAARAYRAMSGFEQGALLGVGVTTLLEALRLKLWGRYVQKKRLREAANAASVPPPVLRLDIVPLDEKDEISFLVHNLGDQVRIRGLIHPLSGVQGWPAGRTMAIWEEDPAEQAVSIERGDRKHLVVGRRKGNGKRSGGYNDERWDLYRYILAFREASGGEKKELPTEWTKKNSYSMDQPQITITITIIVDSPIKRTFTNTIAFQGERMISPPFRESA